jgi:cytochrome P450
VTDIEAVDFFRDNEVHADPYGYYEALRGRCPVQREPHHDVVMVTGYEEAVSVLQDHERFSSCLSVTGPFPGFPVPIEGDDITDLIETHRDKLPMADQLPSLDPPTHTDHRSLLMRLITPKRLKENEEFMWRLCDLQLDSFLNSGSGEYEFINGFASPFTLLVIADLLGVPDEDRDEFARSMAHRPHGDAIGSTKDSLSLNPLEFLYQQFTGYIEDRRTNPREDVLTGLATANFPDGRTPEVLDAVRVAANLFSAGQETTVRLLGNALLTLAERQDVQQQLRANRELISNFVEESLRVESPIKGDFRLSRVPTTVGGVDLPAGTTVMIVNGAANRDPRRFTDPGTFDPARSNARQHIAFGRGIHTCPGAPLARAEARVAVERLLDRTTSITISERAHGPADARRFDYLPTYILRGLMRLHLDVEIAAR